MNVKIKDLTWDESIYPRTHKSRQTINLWISDIRARQKTNRNSTIIRRIECPLSTERLTGNMVQNMQDKRILGTIGRTLLIAKKL